MQKVKILIELNFITPNDMTSQYLDTLDKMEAKKPCSMKDMFTFISYLIGFDFCKISEFKQIRVAKKNTKRKQKRIKTKILLKGSEPNVSKTIQHKSPHNNAGQKINRPYPRA